MPDKQIWSIYVHELTLVDKTFRVGHERVKSNDSIAACLFEHLEYIRAKTSEKCFGLLGIEILALAVGEKGNYAGHICRSLLF